MIHHDPRAHGGMPAGSDVPGYGGAGEGSGALDRALDRWRRARTGSAVPPGPSGELVELARRLDDSGCSFGRVSAAKLEHLSRAYDRLETKLNAVLLAVTGTFLSTLASLLLYYARGAGH